MKQAIIVISIILTIPSIHAQKKLSQAAINDFAINSYWKYKYEGNGNFRAFINTMLFREGFSRAETAVIMENLKTDSKGREAVFKAIFNVSGNSLESIFDALYAMKLEANSAKEISEYIFQKYALRDTDESPTKKLFTGTRTYLDSDTVWRYDVTISGSRITLKAYPGKNNSYYKDKSKVTDTYTGTVKGDKIIIDKNKSEFKIDGNLLFEKNNEGDWNEYREDLKIIVVNEGITDK